MKFKTYLWLEDRKGKSGYIFWKILMEQKLLKQYADNKDNVSLIDIICFEYLLLEFRDLITWIYTSDDEFLTKRIKAITAREKLVSKSNIGDCI